MKKNHFLLFIGLAFLFMAMQSDLPAKKMEKKPSTKNL